VNSPSRIGGSNRMLTVKEVAGLLALSENHIYKDWRVMGLKGYYLSGRLRFREREVNDWIERQAA